MSTQAVKVLDGAPSPDDPTITYTVWVHQDGRVEVFMYIDDSEYVLTDENEGYRDLGNEWVEVADLLAIKLAAPVFAEASHESHTA